MSQSVTKEGIDLLRQLKKSRARGMHGTNIYKPAPEEGNWKRGREVVNPRECSRNRSKVLEESVGLLWDV